MYYICPLYLQINNLQNYVNVQADNQDEQGVCLSACSFFYCYFLL